MPATSDIVTNAMASPIHTTLVAAVGAAGLVETLQGPGPFTVFAPTDDAFAALPAGTVDTLLLPENLTALQGVLTYHVVPGEVFSSTLMDQVGAGGVGQLTTVNGATLQVQMVDGAIQLTDANGGTATVTVADVDQSNGVIHVIDAVLLPPAS
jgi:uncharacterized surface protein with fasciclin (FAS1) repeats